MQPLFHFSTEGLKQTAQRASVLNLTSRGVEFLSQFVTLTILARLLTPADFGLFAMVTPFVWVLMNLSDLGLASAVLQQRELTEGQASAVFRINLLAGLAFGGLFLAASPLLGLLYHDPRVTLIASALSFMFAFSGFTAVQRALLRRALLFGALLRAQIAASVVSSVIALILAFSGTGYWALIARALAEPLTYTIAVWLLTAWIPTRPEWDATTKSMLRYGMYYVGASILHSIGRQADNVLIGWRFGSAELGPYALAYRLFYLPIEQIVGPLSHVMVPALSRLRDEPNRMKRWYSELLRLVTFVAFPPLFSLVVCADDMVYVVAGPQWSKAGEILRLLAPVGALQVGYATIDWLLRSHGHADRALYLTLVNTPTYVICFIIGLPWGAVGVAAGLATANLLLFVPGFIYALRGTSIRLMDALKAMSPALGLTLVTVAAVYVVRAFIAPDWHPAGRLLVTGATIAAIMLIGASLLYGRHILHGASPNKALAPH